MPEDKSMKDIEMEVRGLVVNMVNEYCVRTAKDTLEHSCKDWLYALVCLSIAKSESDAYVSMVKCYTADNG